MTAWYQFLSPPSFTGSLAPLKEARVHWFAAIVLGLAPGSAADKQTAATRLVFHWYPTTRDNYLAALHKFARFVSGRVLPQSDPFVFPDQVLLAFVDALLRRYPTGTCQLKVSTVLD